MSEFMGFRFNKRVGQFDHFKKKSLIKKTKVKSQRGEKKNLRGALDSAQVLSHEKNNYLVEMQ